MYILMKSGGEGRWRIKVAAGLLYLLTDKMYSNLGGHVGSYLFIIKLHCETQ